jgi:hypothetical protein
MVPGGAAGVDHRAEVAEQPVAEVAVAPELPDLSTGFSSGEYGGRGTRVRFGGTARSCAV